jgi:CheY-like chemotaxis protein
MEQRRPLPKSRWHSLSLQGLAPNKFSAIVNAILQGDLSMISSRTPHRGKKVLITDDNNDHIDRLVEYLETDLGVVVEVARTPDECLKKLQAQFYDLLILDYRLPKHDGLWVIDQICSQHRRLPVLMVTSFFSERLQERVSRGYPVEVVSKSNSFRLIARRAGRMLANTAAGPVS